MAITEVDTAARTVRNWSGSDVLLPEIDHLGWGTWRRPEAGGFNLNQYADAWHIEYVVRGSAEWCIGDDVREIPARAVMAFAPQERHGGFGAVMHPGEFGWIIFRPPAAGLPGLAAAAERQLRRGLAALPRHHVPADDAIDAAFRSLIAEHRAPDRFSATVVRSALHSLLVAIVRQAERAAAVEPDARIAAAVAWVDAHLDQPIGADDLAAAMRLSPRRLHERFLDALGCPPKQYILQRKLRRAKELLRRDRGSVLDIALALGFPSSQHFATQFRRASGLTPSAYRQLSRRP